MSSAPVINQWNEQWRSSPLYAQVLGQVGINPATGPVHLNDNQRHLVQRALEAQGVNFNGNEIDSAGNMNEKEGFGHYLKKYGPIAAGIGASLFGIPFLTPGLLGGVGTGAATTAAGLGSGATFDALPNISSTAGAANAAALGGHSMGLLGTLTGIGKNLGSDLAQRALGSVGSGLSGASQASANNRGVALDAEQQAAQIRQRQQEAMEQQLIARAEEDRNSMNNAFTNSVQANRVLNSTGYKPAMLSQTPGAAPTALPNFGTGFSAPTAAMKGDAQALYNQASQRLAQPSGLPTYQPPTPFQNDPNLMHAGAGEKIGSWLGPALSFAGSLRNPVVKQEQK